MLNGDAIAFGGYDLCGLTDIYVCYYYAGEFQIWACRNAKLFPHTKMYKSNQKY